MTDYRKKYETLARRVRETLDACRWMQKQGERDFERPASLRDANRYFFWGLK